MSTKFMCSVDEYWSSKVKPKNTQELANLLSDAWFREHTLWDIKLTDAITGELKEHRIAGNVITDNGALALLKNSFASAANTIPVFNQIVIAQGIGSTTLTTALTSGAAVTTLAVAALPAAIPSGTTVRVGYGTGQTQDFVTSAAAAAAAVSISVTSQNANANYAIGANVVPQPTTGDNPTTLTSAVYSGALGSGQFTYSGTGAGSRQVVIAYTFNGGSTAAGSYTEAGLINGSAINGTSVYLGTHLTTSPLVINSTTNLSVSLTERL